MTEIPLRLPASYLGFSSRVSMCVSMCVSMMCARQNRAFWPADQARPPTTTMMVADGGCSMNMPVASLLIRGVERL
jgi:hypothetical protein